MSVRGRVNKKTADSSARERQSGSRRDEGKQTRAELTARNQLQCEAESMLGATATRGQYSVNRNKNTSLSTHATH